MESPEYYRNATSGGGGMTLGQRECCYGVVLKKMLANFCVCMLFQSLIVREIDEHRSVPRRVCHNLVVRLLVVKHFSLWFYDLKCTKLLLYDFNYK